jgi:hypothetical protein
MMQKVFYCRRFQTGKKILPLLPALGGKGLVDSGCSDTPSASRTRNTISKNWKVQ